VRETLTAKMLYVDPLPSVPAKEDAPSLKTGSSHGG
jgi:hypothetical protein